MQQKYFVRVLLLSAKNKLKVYSPFTYQQHQHFHSMGTCISDTNSKHDNCLFFIED